jgi:hypothetical protein
MTRSFPLAVTLAVLALQALAPAAPAQNDEDIAVRRFAYASHVFRRMLFDQKFKALSSFRELDDHLPDTVLVVLGRTACLNRASLRGDLLGFLQLGGAALIATDQAASGQAQTMLEHAAGVEVLGMPFVGPERRPKSLYKEKLFCPLVQPVPVDEPDLFHGLRLDPTAELRVATNAPTCLKEIHLPRGIKPLARLPAYSVPEMFHQASRQMDPGVWRDSRKTVQDLTGERLQDGPIFAVGGELDSGRILVLADHSLFINQMMWPTDNNNLEFAYKCMEWLSNGRRKRVLLVEDGKIRTDLDVPLKETALPPGADRIVAAVLDDTLARLEQDNTINQTVWDWLMSRAGTTQQLTRWVLYLLTVPLLLYALYHITHRARHRVDTGVPLLAHEAAGHAAVAPLLEQRFHASVRTGNHWETAHHLARQWLAALPPAASEGPRPPRLAIRGGWWRRHSLRRRFDRLWRLARSTEPAPIGPRRLRRLLVELDQMKAALADGFLQIKG